MVKPMKAYYNALDISLVPGPGRYQTLSKGSPLFLCMSFIQLVCALRALCGQAEFWTFTVNQWIDLDTEVTEENVMALADAAAQKYVPLHVIH